MRKLKVIETEREREREREKSNVCVWRFQIEIYWLIDMILAKWIDFKRGFIN